MNQLYLAFPDDVYIQTRPNYLSTNVEEQEDEIKIKFAVNDNKYRDAFVYTGGKLSGIYSNLKEAIKVAKQGGGVVVNYHQKELRFPMIRSRRCQAAHMINYLKCSISVQLIILTAAWMILFMQ